MRGGLATRLRLLILLFLEMLDKLLLMLLASILSSMDLLILLTRGISLISAGRVQLNGDVWLKCLTISLFVLDFSKARRGIPQVDVFSLATLSNIIYISYGIFSISNQVSSLLSKRGQQHRNECPNTWITSFCSPILSTLSRTCCQNST